MKIIILMSLLISNITFAKKCNIKVNLETASHSESIQIDLTRNLEVGMISIDGQETRGIRINDKYIWPNIYTSKKEAIGLEVSWSTSAYVGESMNSVTYSFYRHDQTSSIGYVPKVYIGGIYFTKENKTKRHLPIVKNNSTINLIVESKKDYGYQVNCLPTINYR